MCAAALDSSNQEREEVQAVIAQLSSQREQLMTVIDDLSVQLATAGTTKEACPEGASGTAAFEEQLCALTSQLENMRSEVEALQAELSVSKAQLDEKEASLQEACQVDSTA